MNSIFVSMAAPFPLNNGKRMRNWAFLRVLAELGEVTLVTFVERLENTVAMKKELTKLCSRIETIEISIPKLATFKDCAGRIGALCSREPYSARRLKSSRLTTVVERLIRHSRYDIVICDEVFTLQNIPNDLGIPVLLGKDHIAAIILKRYANNERNAIKRAYAKIEHAKMLRWESHVCSRAALVMACSELERTLIQEMCPTVPVVVVPNVIDVDSYTPMPEQQNNIVLFQGAMDWQPNQDAVIFFVESVLPLISQRVPKARFVVAGKGVAESFRKRFAAHRVEFTGAVPDMRPYMAQASVCVVPLRVAGGTRLKILEAAAMGKAIVSTSIGAEGLEFVNGKEILLADSPQDFADATLATLANRDLSRSLGHAARGRVERQYSLEALQRCISASTYQLVDVDMLQNPCSYT